MKILFKNTVTASRVTGDEALEMLSLERPRGANSYQYEIKL
jgi:hypothetical protein